jgi:hypothetical protein
MKVAKWSGAFALVLLAAAACSSGPPAIHDLKIGKDKEVTQPTNTLAAGDTLFAVGNLDNPPANGKVIGRLAIVDVEGQTPGPIPGLEATLKITGGMNKVNFNFTPPTAGWPNGKYQLQVVLFDGSGAQKDQKNADFTTAGNQPAAPAAAEAPPAADDTQAPAKESEPKQ